MKLIIEHKDWEEIKKTVNYLDERLNDEKPVGTLITSISANLKALLFRIEQG